MHARKVLAGAVLIILVGLSQAHATSFFNNHTLLGTYVVAFRGQNQPNPPSVVGQPIQGVVGTGLLTFDGKGNVTDGDIFATSMAKISSGIIASRAPTARG